MTNFTAARTGLVGADNTALFEKVFANEVLTAFDRANVTAGRTWVRSIASGKSAAFPSHGRAVAAYHTPGTTLVGQNITNGERVITIDGVLIADAFTAEIDEAMQHYDVRGIYATELGRAVARKFDLNVIRTMYLAALDTATNPSGNTGRVILNTDVVGDGTANMLTEGDALAEGIFLACQTLDEKFVQDSERFTLVRPAQYSLMARTTNIINKDWNGAGSYSDGTVIRVAGSEIVKTNNLIASDESAGVGVDGDTVLAKYRVNSANSVFLTAHKSAVGTVKLMDMAMEREWQIRQQGTLMLAKMAVGHGILRPDAVVWGKTS